MENSFNTNLRRIRKEKGITQEQLAEAVGVSAQAVSKWEINSFPDAALLPGIAEKLGVSIDELFGRKNENISIYDRVIEHIKATPADKQFTEVFNICRALLMAKGGCPRYDPLTPDILDCQYDIHSRMDFYEGFMEARNNADLQYFFLFPEPKCGYDKVLKYDERYVKLFSVLAKPNALKALYFLAGRDGTMFFKRDTLVHELGISTENAKEIITDFCDIRFIWEATLNSGESSEKIYQFLARCELVAFLTAARYFMVPPSSFNYNSDCRHKRYFINDTYKKEGGNEKAEN
ncbi:MAG: helix-turn-helix transcriptional regulator [Oscillospiraceae bacterium]|nr:helix-turn-helix transcriptional regulator [Oscillospiraceae bacterium]